MSAGWRQWQESLSCPVCRHGLQTESQEEDNCGLVRGCHYCSGCGSRYPVEGGVHKFLAKTASREGQGGEMWRAEEFANLLPESGLYRTHAEWLEKKLGYSPLVAAAVSEYEAQATKGLLLDLIRAKQPQSVVDLGCGVGYLTFELLSASANGMRVACVDVLPEHVRYVRLRQVEEKKDSILPVLGDAERLPFADGSVEALMGSEVMEHVPDPAACAREIMRVLTPGGLVVLSTPNRQPYEAYNRTRLVLRRLLRRPLGPGEDFFDNPLRHEELVAIFAAAGFKIEKVRFGIKVPMSKRFFMYLPRPLAQALLLALERFLPGRWFGVSVLLACRKDGGAS